MLTLTILKTEQKSSLPNLNQVKDFVKEKITGNEPRVKFRKMLDRKTGAKSKTYLVLLIIYLILLREVILIH